MAEHVITTNGGANCSAILLYLLNLKLRFSLLIPFHAPQHGMTVGIIKWISLDLCCRSAMADQYRVSFFIHGKGIVPGTIEGTAFIRLKHRHSFLLPVLWIQQIFRFRNGKHSHTIIGTCVACRISHKDFSTMMKNCRSFVHPEASSFPFIIRRR